MPPRPETAPDATAECAQATTFPEWIEAYGPDLLATVLSVHPRTTDNWKKRISRPEIRHCKIILGLAPHLTLSELMGLEVEG